MLSSSFHTSSLLLQETKKVLHQNPQKILDNNAYVQRTNIGIFGAMNSGKSTLMNLFTKSNTSIVDSTPGTTADVKVALMEFHSVGPTKLFDTPGSNEWKLHEKAELGKKKLEKTLLTMKESDVMIVAVNPFDENSIEEAKFLIEKSVFEFGCSSNIALIYNIFSEKLKEKQAKNENFSISELFEKIENEKLFSRLKKEKKPIEKFVLGTTYCDFHSPNASELLSNFIENCNEKKKQILKTEKNLKKREIPILPPLERDSTCFLNIPMDAETPGGRLLRPQSLSVEHLLRNFNNVFCHRMDLAKARSKDPKIVASEKQRFLKTLDTFSKNGKLDLLVTDSQAMDIVHPWTLTTEKKEIVPITTFSVCMINFMSDGRLNKFISALRTLKDLKAGDKVLICEACNHNRLTTDVCEDIGTVQIPKKLQNLVSENMQKIAKKESKNLLKIRHAFGREYQNIEDLSEYKLVVHCGSCMIDKQKMAARLRDLETIGVPITNYGLLLSWFQSKFALERILRPWEKFYGESFDLSMT